MNLGSELAGAATDIKRNWRDWIALIMFYPLRALARMFVRARAWWYVWRQRRRGGFPCVNACGRVYADAAGAALCCQGGPRATNILRIDDG